ncbi:insulinase family protein [Phormidesmis priestleyi ULC007]|uniref:Insulinase family protein n=1 Tax=Phormidesmis priestleyi ULC007 TaxID=1920490 RepID=A0A2T1DMK9_9CYAN|nr:pitrilysin family protein [Phormidesmis priestleyi]PSB21723.1 insulinase family protein [Phormidesmis priestleyi ULC007]PZO50846.1 MAG: insulinase family protein [Phormidesmis priestleyi]
MQAVSRFLAIFWVVVLSWSVVSQAALAQTLTLETTPVQSIQPYLDRVIDRVTEFKLDNGLKFIVLERHEAPVVSFLTYANVGGADEPDKKTGVAHFLEHLAFKGTTRIGTENYQAEKPLLDRLDQLAEQLQKDTEKTTRDRLQKEFDQTEASAGKLARQNEFGRIVEQAGGVGLNANTSSEATRYFYSFPSNKLELWMSLESERFLEPVFREFYKEKAVILEERRLRTENSPIGQMIEVFLDAAFKVHPYRRPVIGYDQDIRNLTRPDVQQFFDTHYTPNNLTIAIVGDVNPVEVERLAQTYFGRYHAQPKPPEVTAIEPPQTQTRAVTLKLNSQPWYLEGYHRPQLSHPDSVVYEAIASLLSDGRTSRLYKSLVEEKQVALTAQGFNGFPGDKYPTLIMFYALTAPGKSVDDVSTALRLEIERLKTEPVSAQELDRVKTQARAGLLRSLDSNSGMAESLLEYEIKTGSWRNLFKQVDAIAAITPADIQRVSQATFTSQNRTIGRILPQEIKP